MVLGNGSASASTCFASQPDLFYHDNYENIPRN